MFGGGNRQMKQMMQQMGIDMEQFDDVKRVVIERENKTLVFEGPQVSLMDAKGQKIYQVIGNPKEEEEKGYEVEQEDLDLVVEETGASKEEAKAALEDSEGDIADAIMELE